MTARIAPEVVAYVLRRDAGCVVARLAERGRIPPVRVCRDRSGDDVPGAASLLPGRDVDRVLTVAHVRDRGRGGRLGRRPPDDPRHLTAVCAGHHLLDPVCDRADVRDALDERLQLLEGSPRVDRPHEAIRRVRSASE